MLFKLNERNIHVSLDDLVYENNVAENLNHIQLHTFSDLSFSIVTYSNPISGFSVIGD